MSELFKEEHWYGEFFVNQDHTNRFIGEIDYSPEDGVILSYTIVGAEVPDSVEIVHGVLSTGEPCTLIGKFNLENSGSKFKNKVSSRNGKAGFICLVIGDFLEEEELLYNVNFSLTGMQEFFFPQGFKSHQKFLEKPLFNIDTKYGDLEVSNNASFGLLPSDITTQIYSRNKNASDELKKSFAEINSQYPNSMFMLKKDIAYRVNLKIKSGSDVVSAYKHIIDIANLFSMLLYGPVYPESIQAIKNGDEGRTTIKIYPSMSLNKSTVEICLKDRHHHFMPITKSNIDLSEIITKWLEIPNKYSTIIASIQNETGVRNEHSMFGEFILYVTQLEAISDEDLVKEKRYEYPIEQYGTKEMKAQIIHILSKAGEDNIGKGISKVRNEIAHVGRPKSFLKKLSMRDIVDLSQYLQITILGYILSNLGVNKDLISKYQNEFTTRYTV